MTGAEGVASTATVQLASSTTASAKRQAASQCIAPPVRLGESGPVTQIRIGVFTRAVSSSCNGPSPQITSRAAGGTDQSCKGVDSHVVSHGSFHTRPERKITLHDPETSVMPTSRGAILVCRLVAQSKIAQAERLYNT